MYPFKIAPINRIRLEPGDRYDPAMQKQAFTTVLGGRYTTGLLVPIRRDLILRSIRTATRTATRVLLYFTSVSAPHFNQLEFRIWNSEKTRTCGGLLFIVLTQL